MLSGELADADTVREIEDAFDALGEGRIDVHNQVIASAIRKVQQSEPVDVVVLAQMSMSVLPIAGQPGRNYLDDPGSKRGWQANPRSAWSSCPVGTDLG